MIINQSILTYLALGYKFNNLSISIVPNNIATNILICTTLDIQVRWNMDAVQMGFLDFIRG
jgi:hypothetical protein